LATDGSEQEQGSDEINPECYSKQPRVNCRSDVKVRHCWKGDVMIAMIKQQEVEEKSIAGNGSLEPRIWQGWAFKTIGSH
jgi:hypothetical protein